MNILNMIKLMFNVVFTSKYLQIYTYLNDKMAKRIRVDRVMFCVDILRIESFMKVNHENFELISKYL